MQVVWFLIVYFNNVHFVSLHITVDSGPDTSISACAFVLILGLPFCRY